MTDHEPKARTKVHSCDGCGCATPLASLVLHRWEERVGRISGTVSVSLSASQSASRGGRPTQRRGRSVRFTSGRTLYKARTSKLCPNCDLTARSRLPAQPRSLVGKMIEEFLPSLTRR